MPPREMIRVLIVDDIYQTRENIRRMLQFNAHLSVVGMARTGAEAIDLTEQTKPDVIVMDINMPDMDGIAATQEIKKKYPWIQTVILSIQSDPSYMRRAMLAGARDYLTKPPLLDELIDAVLKAGACAIDEQHKMGFEGGVTYDQLKRAVLELTILETQIFDISSRIEVSRAHPALGLLIHKINSIGNGVYHDTRSPLGIISDVAQSISQEPFNTDQASLIEEIQNRVEVCYWITENFLKISVSEKLSYSRVNVKELIEKAVKLTVLNTKKKVAFNISIPDELVILADRKLLLYAFINILSNAIHNIPAQGSIPITLEHDSKKLIITFEDSGKKIPEEKVPALFHISASEKHILSETALFVTRRILQQQQGDVFYVKDPFSKKHLWVIQLNLAPPIYKLPEQLDIKYYEAITDHLKKLKRHLKKLETDLQSEQSGALQPQHEKVAEKLYRKITLSFARKLNRELGIIAKKIEALAFCSFSLSQAYLRDINTMQKSCEFALLLSRNFIEIGENTKLKYQFSNPIDIVQNVLSMLEYKIIPGVFEISAEIDPLVEEVQMDPIQIQQVFLNLFRNALDAMPRGGHLRYSIQSAQNETLFEVSDTGIGIPAENMERLFALGFTTKAGGSGIGLYSIKKIIEKHGGTIHVQSVVAKGTTFTVCLPNHLREQDQSHG